MQLLRIVFILLWCALPAAAADSAAGSAGDDVPSASALRAKVAAATGPRPPSYAERIGYVRGGTAGTETIVRSGDDVRTNETFGPLQHAYGSYARQAWRQNDNGQTVLVQPEPDDVAVKDAYTTTVAHVSAPVDALVLSHLNAAGSGYKEYVDAAGRIVRFETIRPTETTVTRYDDFHTVAGYTTAWHWTVSDGHAANDAEYHVESLDARPVTAAELAIPAPRRALVEFPAGKTTVDLPVQLVRNKFIVRVMIAGRGMDFELDTGASGIVISDAVARSLGLQSVASFSNAANAGRVRDQLAIVPEMSVGELRLHDVVVQSIPFAFDEREDVKVVGLLGFDFIAELKLRLDYEHGTVSASADDLHVDTSPRGSIALFVRLGTMQPETTVAINGTTAERFAIDTGAGGSLLIFDYFARRNPQALVDRGGGTGRDVRLTGVGGNIDVRPYQLDRVTIGDMNFKDFVAYRVVNRGSYASDTDGVIGAEMLHYFTVYLDYADSRIYLIPNSTGEAAVKG